MYICTHIYTRGKALNGLSWYKLSRRLLQGFTWKAAEVLMVGGRQGDFMKSEGIGVTANKSRALRKLEPVSGTK